MDGNDCISSPRSPATSMSSARRWALGGLLAVLVCGVLAPTAAAELVFINDMPASSSGLQVQVTPGQDQFTITNPQSNGPGNAITSMFGNVGVLALMRDGFQSAGPPTRPDGTTTAGPTGTCSGLKPGPAAFAHGIRYSVEWKCDLTNQYASQAAGAILPGESETFTFTPTQGDETNIFSPDKWILYITFNFANLPPNCRPTISSSFASAFTSSTLGVTADDCTVPSHTTITKMRIDQRHRTADFHLKAKRAKSYQCELLRNGKVKYHHACGAHKKYANALSPGKYLFLAWGVNHVGIDRTAAMLAFTIK